MIVIRILTGAPHIARSNLTLILPVVLLAVITVTGCAKDDVSITSSAAVGDLSGHVYYEGSSQTLSGVAVKCGNYATRTDSRGFYYLRALSQGTHTITAQKDGFERYSAIVTVTSRTAYNITLTPIQGSIYGTVFRAGTVEPISDVKVSCAGRVTTTGSDGTYRLIDIPYGKRVISAVTSKLEYHAFRSEITVRGAMVLNIPLTPL